MTTAIKSRRPLQVRLPSALVPETPDQVQARAEALLEGMLVLLADTRELCTIGDECIRTLTMAVEPNLELVHGWLDSELPLSTEKACSAIELVFDSRASLLGLEALYRESTRSILIAEALKRIDQLVLLLDQPNPFWARVEPVNPFQAGRNLVVAMLRDAERLGANGSDTPECRRRYRNGQAQERFVEPYLRQLIQNPEWMDGFTAVLSGALYASTYGWINADHYANIPEAEFQAGEVGADGTEPHPED